MGALYVTTFFLPLLMITEYEAIDISQDVIFNLLSHIRSFFYTVLLLCGAKEFSKNSNLYGISETKNISIGPPV